MEPARTPHSHQPSAFKPVELPTAHLTASRPPDQQPTSVGVIPLRVHSILDYGAAAVLIATPLFMDFGGSTAARSVFYGTGAFIAFYSLLTAYPYAIIRQIPLSFHMALEIIVGVFLMLAPSLWGYQPRISNFEYVWHFALGLGLIGLVALTRRPLEPMGVLGASPESLGNPVIGPDTADRTQGNDWRNAA